MRIRYQTQIVSSNVIGNGCMISWIFCRQHKKKVIGYRFGIGECEKLEVKEIAKLCGYSSLGSVENAKERALQNLRKRLVPDFQPRNRRNERLRAARIEKGWTTVEAGELLRMDTPRNYERWERGEYRPSEENLDKLCQLFHKSREEIGF